MSISLTGNFALRKNHIRQSLNISGNTLSILVLLASHYNKNLSRRYIIDLLWEGVSEDKARSALNTALWRIKKLVLKFNGLSLESCDDFVKFNVETAIDLDIRNIDRACATLDRTSRENFELPSSLHSELESAERSCRGPFLSGHSDLWMLSHRERASLNVIKIRTALMRHATSGEDYEKAIFYGRKILEQDALREGTQRELMWVYVMNGQRAQAIKQYHELRSLLKNELEIEPMPETQALLAHIKADNLTGAYEKGFAEIDFIKKFDMNRKALLRSLVNITP